MVMAWARIETASACDDPHFRLSFTSHLARNKRFDDTFSKHKWTAAKTRFKPRLDLARGLPANRRGVAIDQPRCGGRLWPNWSREPKATLGLTLPGCSRWLGLQIKPLAKALGTPSLRWHHLGIPRSGRAWAQLSNEKVRT
jgi:hypothetical protein